MGFRSRLSTSPSGVRGSVGYAPSNLGATGEGQFAELASSLSGIAGTLTERKKKEDTILAKDKLAEFEIQSATELQQLSNISDNKSRIDEQFAQSFDTRSKHLIDSASSDAERQVIAAGLPGLKTRYMISAMGEEVKRNTRAAVGGVEKFGNTKANQLTGSATPMEDLPKAVEEFNSLVDSDVVLDPNVKAELKEGNRAMMTGAAIQGRINQDWEAGFNELMDGKYDAMIPNSEKERLIGYAMTRQRRELTAEKARIAKIETDIKAHISEADNRLNNGMNPQLSLRSAVALMAGLPEEMSAGYAPQISDRASQVDQIMRFASLSNTQQSRQLASLEGADNRGRLDANGQDLLKRYRKVNKELSTGSLESKIKYDVIDPPPFLNAENMADRELYSQKLVYMGGEDVPLFTEAELTDVKNRFASADNLGKFQIFNEYAPHELLRKSLLKELTKEGSPESRRYAVAMDASTRDPKTALTILQGNEMIKANAVQPYGLQVKQMAQQLYGNLFVNNGALQSEMVEAATAIYMAKSFQSSPDGSKLKNAQTALENPDKKLMNEALQEVLPSNQARVGSTETFTPSKNISADAFKDEYNNLQNNPSWWMRAKWLDKTGKYAPVNEQPKYPSGDGVEGTHLNGLVFRDIGTYYPMMDGKQVQDDQGRMLIIDMSYMNE